MKKIKRAMALKEMEIKEAGGKPVYFSISFYPVGAWIETSTARRRGLASPVAPPVGAWIETSYSQ